MSETKFTPGPWSFKPAPYGWDIFVSDKPTERALWVASSHSPIGKDSPFYPSKSEVEANAHLIAAAPDLYDGCNALLGLIQLVLGRDDLTPALREVLTTNHRIGEAEAALARAVPTPERNA